MDPISTISGPVDAASFVDGSSLASGAKVMAEVAQLINKTNEVIAGLTDVADDLNTEEATRAAADTALAGADTAMDLRVDAVESDVASHDGTLSTHESRIGALEDVSGSYGASVVVNSNITLTVANVVAYRVIIMQNPGAPSATASVTLPAVGDELFDVRPITIINDGFDVVNVYLEAASGPGEPNAYWGVLSTAAAPDDLIALAGGEFLTVVGTQHRSDQGASVWFLIGGKDYSDIVLA